MSDFDDLVDQYTSYLARVEPAATGEARQRVTAWLRDGVPDLKIRIMLARSADRAAASPQPAHP